VSPEANDIFDFIMALHRSCDGQWEQLATSAQVDMAEVEKFLNYAAVFLSNIGNYFVSTYALMSYAFRNLIML
jgi:dipeptidyl-peptidase-3